MKTDLVVHVVDDDAAVRDSIAFLLDSAGLASRTYDSATALLEHSGALEPGCIVTDVRMPGLSGLEMVRRLAAAGNTLPVIVITGHADVPLAIEAMHAGVADFLEKPFDDDALMSAIDTALARGAEARDQAAHTREIMGRLDTLSMRERQVLDGLVAGHANKVIAFDLDISPRTVEVYRANVMTKMQARSLSELVRMSMVAERP
ncbi:response regulator [Rhizobium sp. CRIBSB]|nr:response regulator [Rhizobium sp. CRIBSB]